MQPTTKNTESLKQLLDYNVSKVFVAEAQLQLAIPSWIKKTISKKLKQILNNYLADIQRNKDNIRLYLQKENASTADITDEVMSAYLTEMHNRLDKCTVSAVFDAQLAAAIQLVNHYKISCYGTAAAYARALGKEEDALVFRQAEAYEKKTDDLLCRLAECDLNEKTKYH